MSMRHKTPTILQMEAAECGSTALAIILGYYGRHVSLPELRTECGISRDGSKAVNILKAARRYGLNAQAANAEDWQAVFEVSLPSIVFWEFNHFVVVEGKKGNKIYINDPAVGPKVITPEEFSRSFTGVILIFEPTEKFQKAGKPFSFLAVVKQRLKNYHAPLGYIVLISLALVIPGILIPGFSKIFIDNILIHHTAYWFVPLLTGMALTALLRGIFTWLQQFHLIRFQTHLYQHTTQKFMQHVLRLPLLFFSQRYLGDVDERVNSNNEIAELLSGEINTSLVSLVSLVFYALVMLLMSWPLACITIFISLSSLLILYYLIGEIQNLSFRYVQEHGKLVGLEMNGIQLIETLKVSGAEDPFFQRWAGMHARIINSQQKIAFYGSLLQIGPQFLNTLSTLILLGLGSWLVIHGHSTIGTLVALQSLLASFNGPLLTLLGFGTTLPQIRGDIARLDDVLEHPLDLRFITEPKETIKISSEVVVQKTEKSLEIRNLSFGYSPLDPPLLQDISFNVNSGQRIAIIGASGCGKSTLARIIANLYQPWTGHIDLEGKALTNIDPHSLSQALSFVDQDIFLLKATLRDNLTLWNKDIDDSRLITALQIACIHDDVISRGGLDMMVEERGTNFSGGQRQRLEIARAVANDPLLLILDEATNALDEEMEKQIYQNLKQLPCSIIIISHRVQAVKDCDQLIVLDQGKIRQQGTHEELINQDGLYQQFYECRDE